MCKRKISTILVVILTILNLVILRSNGLSAEIKDKLVTVGSKHFTGNFILAEMIATLIEKNTDIAVKKVIPLGGTQIVQAAIQKGSIDIYPEYTSGAVITGVLGLKNDPPVTDPDEAFRITKKGFKEKYDIEVLPLFGNKMVDGYALMMRKAQAQSLGCTRISDLKKHANGLTLGCTHEFSQRPDGVPGLQKVYEFSFGKIVSLDAGLMYDALKNKNVDLISGFASDPRAITYDFVVLEDNQRFTGPQCPIILIRGDTLKRFPELGPLLSKLGDKMGVDIRTMQKLNYEVDVEKKEPLEVAQQFLKSLKLIK
jgi:glycine betaine/choline ABC-type transport system substrate-binding protein